MAKLATLALCCALLVCASAQSVSNAPAPAPGTEAACTLTTELEQGPYWLDDIMFRSNITENQVGIPLLLRIKIANTDCEPLADVFVDIWHCNATGFYSGFTLSGGEGDVEGGGSQVFGPQGSMALAPGGSYLESSASGPGTGGPPDFPGGAMGGPTGGPAEGMPSSASGSMAGTMPTTNTGSGSTSSSDSIPAAAAAAGQTSATTDDLTWLRGVQQTDEDGLVEFETIVPGWYAGRTPHIHLRVHVPYNLTLDESEQFDDSHVAHTAQFFFDDTFYSQNIAPIQPYLLDTTTRTTNSEDHVYAADPSAVLDITQDDSYFADGLIATMTAHIDPTSTPAPGV